MPFFIAKRWPNGDLDIVKRDAAVGERVVVILRDDLSTEGHYDVGQTHAAIPIDQYFRIFGQP